MKVALVGIHMILTGVTRPMLAVRGSIKPIEDTA
jgi:hypothetical protein